MMQSSEEAELKCLCEHLDDTLTDFFGTLTELLNTRRDLENFIKEGFFLMARVRIFFDLWILGFSMCWTPAKLWGFVIIWFFSFQNICEGLVLGSDWSLFTSSGWKLADAVYLWRTLWIAIIDDFTVCFLLLVMPNCFAIRLVSLISLFRTLRIMSYCLIPSFNYY